MSPSWTETTRQMGADGAGLDRIGSEAGGRGLDGGGGRVQPGAARATQSAATTRRLNAFAGFKNRRLTSVFLRGNLLA